MDSQPLIIRTCRHILANGLHCQGAAVRGRSCCRHHLDAGTRMRNMARACRRSLKLRFRILDSPRALAINRAEVNRVVATERIDPDAARMMLWAMDLCAAALKAEDDLLRRKIRCCNSNQHYHLPSTPSFSGACLKNHLEVLESTGGGGGGTATWGPTTVWKRRIPGKQQVLRLRARPIRKKRGSETQGERSAQDDKL